MEEQHRFVSLAATYFAYLANRRVPIDGPAPPGAHFRPWRLNEPSGRMQALAHQAGEFGGLERFL